MTISDTYWARNRASIISRAGPSPDASFATTDVTGESLFDAKGMDVNVVGTNLVVTASTSSDKNASGAYGTAYGVLLISTNGWHPCGSAATHYGRDNLATGTTWNFGVSTTGRQLYSLGGGNADVMTSNAAWEDSHKDGSIYRIGQGKQLNMNGTGIGAGAEYGARDGPGSSCGPVLRP